MATQDIGKKFETENSEYDYLKEWNITSNDKRFEMTFTPLINRSSLTDIKILISDNEDENTYLYNMGKIDWAMDMLDIKKVLLLRGDGC